MRFSTVSLLPLGISIGLSQAFLQLSGARSSSNVMLRRMQQQQGRLHTLQIANLSRKNLRMSDESNEVEKKEDESVTAEAPEAPQAVEAPKAPQTVGPAIQPPEDRKREEEMLKMSKPPENKWASGAFKRGVALQAVVLSIVIFLQFQPPEVASLSICLPFAKGGCVGLIDYFRIVFTGAPIPPM